MRPEPTRDAKASPSDGDREEEHQVAEHDAERSVVWRQPGHGSSSGGRARARGARPPATIAAQSPNRYSTSGGHARAPGRAVGDGEQGPDQARPEEQKAGDHQLRGLHWLGPDYRGRVSASGAPGASARGAGSARDQGLEARLELGRNRLRRRRGAPGRSVSAGLPSPRDTPRSPSRPPHRHRVDQDPESAGRAGRRTVCSPSSASTSAGISRQWTMR